MKIKRWIVLACVAGLIIFGSLIAYTRPVLPFIQLPGEAYPGTEGFWPEFLFNGAGITNTFVATIVMWILLLILALALRARSRTADEVPSGFYNLFEAMTEGALNFAENIAGSKVRDFFPFFMTFLLMILIANWMELVPGVDSIGVWEYLPHKVALTEVEKEAREFENAEIPFSEEQYEERFHELEHAAELLQEGDLRDGLLLVRANGNADESAPIEENSKGQPIGSNPEAAQWTIVPFLRAAATDLNFTLAFALVSMFMVQYYGFKYLGGRDYLAKFFPFIAPGFGKAVGKSPIKAIDPAVGALELVSEFSKILSFSFRLLGNIFAGQVLLFVMAFILPVLNIAFFGLELFVGLIQAAVFALLSLIFMSGATVSHAHYDDDHH